MNRVTHTFIPTHQSYTNGHTLVDFEAEAVERAARGEENGSLFGTATEDTALGPVASENQEAG